MNNFHDFLDIYLCISRDKVVVGPVSSEPWGRGAAGIVPSPPVSKPTAAPTLVEALGVAMEESGSLVSQSEPAVAPGAAICGPDEGVVPKQQSACLIIIWFLYLWNVAFYFLKYFPWPSY